MKGEIKDKTGTTNVQKTLLKGFTMTNYCKSIFVDNKIAGIYGVVASLDDKNMGSPFLLCTPEIRKLKLDLLESVEIE